MAASTPHVQIILEEHSVPKNLETALQRVGAAASFWSFSDALRLGLTASADAVVVVALNDDPNAGDRLQSLFDRMADRPRATLVLRAESGPQARTGHPPTLPVAFGAGLDADELTTRLSTMIEMRDSLESLHRSRGIMDHAPQPPIPDIYLQQLYQAGQIQRQLLPNVLPHYGPVSFSAIYRPAEYVSGDFYDIQQLDKEHIGVAVADVTGHGMPAGLLTVFLKRALRGRDGGAAAGHVLQPDEMLRRLNDEILELNFTDCTFAAVAYAIMNTRTLNLRLARAGMPYPILRRAKGSSKLLRPAGSLIGIEPQATFAVEQAQLAAGDTLLLYTDGLERVVLPCPFADGHRRPATLAHNAATQPTRAGEGGNGNASRTAALLSFFRRPAEAARRAIGSAPVPPDEAITRSRWYAVLREQGEQAALDHLTGRHDLLRRIGHPVDDLTVLAVRVEC